MKDVRQYFIKAGYRENFREGQTSMPWGGDTVEDSHTYQYAVYDRARELILKHGLRSVLDLGCGMGVKLVELIYPVCSDITGVDEPGTISRCKALHRVGQWHDDNLEEPTFNPGRTFDLIIAADVIEHLVNPDRLLELIKRYASGRSLIVLSTVERDCNRGRDHMGPSPNCAHAREWNMAEFHKYIKSRGFRIQQHFCTFTFKDEYLSAQQPASQPEMGRLLRLLRQPGRIPGAIRWRSRVFRESLKRLLQPWRGDIGPLGPTQVIVCRK